MNVRLKPIMFVGTCSDAGKSVINAAFCRIFKQDGYHPAPFKAQNMSLNSYSTPEGGEMGRAQVVQAEACGIAPHTDMNPILLKPTNDKSSQVVLNGKPVGNMSAKDYFGIQNQKEELFKEAIEAFNRLEARYNPIVLEGAGSISELNLRDRDITNMRMAMKAGASTYLIADIDRGGVFGSVYGTIALLRPEERALMKGVIINKFRGDKTILDPGIQMLEERGGVPVSGVVPYMDVQLEDEDSLTERFDKKTDGLIDIAVIRYPRISNFTDFNVFEQMSEVTVRYVSTVNELRHPDIVFLPGSKNTMGDLLWMRQNGLEAAVKKLSCEIPVFGICGGYQMLGASIADPDGVEEGGFMRGMELLPIDTVLKDSKTRLQTSGEIAHVDGVLSRLSGCHFLGYEIHMGKSAYSTASDEQGTCADRKNKLNNVISDGRNVYGSYIHGIFDTAEAARVIVDYIADKKGIDVNDSAILSYKSFKEKQYDRLADTLREYLDMDAVYGMLREARYD